MPRSDSNSERGENLELLVGSGGLVLVGRLLVELGPLVAHLPQVSPQAVAVVNLHRPPYCLAVIPLSGTKAGFCLLGVFVQKDTDILPY